MPAPSGDRVALHLEPAAPAPGADEPMADAGPLRWGAEGSSNSSSSSSEEDEAPDIASYEELRRVIDAMDDEVWCSEGKVAAAVVGRLAPRELGPHAPDHAAAAGRRTDKQTCMGAKT